MNSRFSNNRQVLPVGLVTLILLSCWGVIWLLLDPVWHKWDYKSLDYVYRLAVQKGHGPEPAFAPDIIYLTITDDTYDAFGTNYLDRRNLAPVNLALRQLDVEGIIYDIIFARASTPEADRLFAASIADAGNVHLPFALARSSEPVAFQWQAGMAYERLRSEFIGEPQESRLQHARPFYAQRALTQHDAFAEAALASGDIAVRADADSIYRHACLLTRIDTQYFPTLALSVFLTWAGASLADVQVAWGRHLTIPALPHNSISQDVVIPIDEQGCTFIPFVRPMGEDFRQMPAHQFLEYFQNPQFRGNLLDWFEGRFVLIGDVATGGSDLGYTPLEADVPLVVLHAALLNALLTKTFYQPWCSWQAGIMIMAMVLLMGVIACIRSTYVLYAAGAVCISLLVLLAWVEMLHFRLFPLTTMFAAGVLTIGTLVVFRELSTSRERAFIKNVFGRYVPGKVVNELLSNPEMIVLGGEERDVSVLFSDITGFTTIAESLDPPVMVMLLNEYFSEMTEIILQHDGIIDKFQGDAIMAEFGIPALTEQHADQAVSAAISMQQRLVTLRTNWRKQGLPELCCRIGINSGKVIVGNMGARAIMDYTVMGDAVNLASRLEQANKTYQTSLIISEFTLARLTPDRFNIRFLDTVQVRGRQQAVKIYEVMIG